MLYLILALFGCGNENLIGKHTIEEKYVYPSYYDVWVETDTAIVEIEVPVDDTGTDPIWVDSFEQPSASSGVDIIWVIDPSGSMNSHRTRLLAGIADMMAAMPSVSWRLAIISADSNHSINNTDFPLLPGDSAADAQAMYSSAVTGAREEGFNAVTEYMNGSFAQSWMREDASLLVLFVSDEEEQSTANYPSVTSFTDWLDEQRTSVYVASIVNHDPSVSTCNSNPTYVGYRYMDAANYYSGQVLDICSEDWSGGVLDAANGAVPYNSYPLSHRPLYTDNIVVFVDGVVYHEAYWDYNATHNRIDFILEPPGGSLVEIAYHY